METLPKIDRFEFEVDMTTVDKLHRMRPSALCNMMLACAGRHADRRGFGATRKLGWVMARMVLDIRNIPLGSQKFTIETFIKNAYRGFTDRCLRAVDENGNELAAMMCTFAMIDLETRSAVDLNGDIGVAMNGCLVPDEPLALRRIPSINRMPVEEVTFKRRPHYSDIDINGHMNSVRYLDHILDHFPIEFINSHDLTDFIVAYMKEGEADEELSYGIKELEQDKYLVQVTKENSVTALRCELHFKPIPRR
jgi:acyl-ACP thioesterase